jgi:hypothetical protein
MSELTVASISEEVWGEVLVDEVDVVERERTPQEITDDLIGEYEVKLNELRNSFYTNTYALVFDGAQLGVEQKIYGDYSNVELYLKEVLSFINNKIGWKGQDFLNVKGMFNEINHTYQAYRKVKDGDVLLSAHTIEAFFKLTLETQGVGLKDGLKREYLLKPFHNALKPVEKDYMEMKELEQDLRELYIQKEQFRMEAEMGSTSHDHSDDVAIAGSGA